MVDDEGGMVLDGMVCAWWFDGQRMHEPYIKRTCEIIAMSDLHAAWPGKGGEGKGGGAVVPLLPDDLSMDCAATVLRFGLTQPVINQR